MRPAKLSKKIPPLRKFKITETVNIMQDVFIEFLNDFEIN